MSDPKSSRLTAKIRSLFSKPKPKVAPHNGRACGTASPTTDSYPVGKVTHDSIGRWVCWHRANLVTKGTVLVKDPVTGRIKKRSKVGDRSDVFYSENGRLITD